MTGFISYRMLSKPVPPAGKASENDRREFWTAMRTQVPTSASQARAILGAWQSGDKRRLEAELERVETTIAADAAEEERLELLSEIAHGLRTADQPFSDQLYGSLLAHLAFSSRNAMNARYSTPVSTSGRAALVTALQ
jgi:hypothetical protein